MQFHEQTRTSTPKKKPQKFDMTTHRCKPHATTVQHPKHAETLVSKHVLSSNNTEWTRLSEHSRNQNCANDTLSLASYLLMSSASRATVEEPASKRSNVWKQIDNLDHKPLHLEEDRVMFCLSTEKTPGGSGGRALQEHSATQGPLHPPSTVKQPSWQLCSTGRQCNTTLRSTM